MFTLLILGSSMFSFAVPVVPIVVMGHCNELGKTDNVVFGECNDPKDVNCVTCDGKGDGPIKDNVGRFYNDPANPNIGTGYTDVNVVTTVTPSGMQYTTTINASNQIITIYQQWLIYFNLSNPLLQ